jgi:hypothetical protein
MALITTIIVIAEARSRVGKKRWYDVSGGKVEENRGERERSITATVRASNGDIAGSNRNNSIT